MKPQTARVLARLRQRPVGAMDFQPPNICDGGQPITRVAGRILELRELGFEIRSDRAANGTAMYTLLVDVERVETPNEGAAVMTTVEARGTADREAGAVSATVDLDVGRTPGVQLTRQVGRDEDDRAEYAHVTPRRDGPSQGPVCDAAPPAISRVAGADLQAPSLFDVDQFTDPRWKDIAA